MLVREAKYPVPAERQQDPPHVSFVERLR